MSRILWSDQKLYLKNHLISLSRDDAAVMLGRANGMVKLMNDEFPSIIVWHCANYCLGLAVHGTMKNTLVEEINSRRSIMCVIFSRELRNYSDLSVTELSRIGIVLNVFVRFLSHLEYQRSVSSTFRRREI